MGACGLACGAEGHARRPKYEAEEREKEAGGKTKKRKGARKVVPDALPGAPEDAVPKESAEEVLGAQFSNGVIVECSGVIHAELKGIEIESCINANEFWLFSASIKFEKTISIGMI